VGYVRINYCKRDLGEVCKDVARYSGWSEDCSKPGLAVHGIFFDETPNHYSPNVAEFLDSVTQYVKDMSGILGDRVVSNPRLKRR
jgi:hypothetical protein